MTDLKTVIEAHWGGLTPGQRRVGEYILSNPFLVATMGIEDLAQATGVSPATITRFVHSLGLRNYGDFRAIAIRRYQDLLQPIENVGRAQERSSAEILDSTLAKLSGNIATLADGLDPDLCEQLVDRMMAAETVGFLGFGGTTYSLAYLAGLTEPYLRRQLLLDGSGGHERMARLIGRMGPHDLLIAMTLPRYSVATLEFVRLARASGVPVVGLTDKANSPLAELCDQTIFLPAEHPVLNNSGVAAIAFFEALAALLIARHGGATRATAITRLIFPYLYTDDDSSPDSKDLK